VKYTTNAKSLTVPETQAITDANTVTHKTTLKQQQRGINVLHSSFMKNPCSSFSWEMTTDTHILTTCKPLTTTIFMPSPPIDAAEALHFRVVCLWMRASVRQGVHSVSMITPEQVEAFWPNLTQIFYTMVRRTEYILKVDWARSRSLQGQIFESVVVAGGGIHINAWVSEYHLVSA